MSDKLLTELFPNEEAEVIAITGGRMVKTRLRSLGIIEGQKIRKISKVGLGGPVIVLINRAQLAIGFGMAHMVVVRTK